MTTNSKLVMRSTQRTIRLFLEKTKKNHITAVTDQKKLNEIIIISSSSRRWSRHLYKPSKNLYNYLQMNTKTTHHQPKQQLLEKQTQNTNNLRDNESTRSDTQTEKKSLQKRSPSGQTRESLLESDVSVLVLFLKK